MGRVRLAGASLFVLAGAFASPFSFAQFGGGLSPEGIAELEAVKKRLAPVPYQPSNAPGCERWKGRGIVVRGEPDAVCTAGCALQMVEGWGAGSRWVVSGSRCTRSKPVVREQTAVVAEPVQQLEVPARVPQSSSRGQWRCVNKVDRGVVRQICGESAK